MPQLQMVFEEVEQAIFQRAGMPLERLEKRCKATAVLRLAVFGAQTARSLLLLHESSLATTAEGVRRTLFETWALMWFLLDVDDGSKLQKRFEIPAAPLLERSDRVRSKLEHWISQRYGKWPKFKEYYHGASNVGIHPTYESTTNAMAEATARLGYAEREAAELLAKQRSAAFADLEFQLYFLLSIVVATFDKAPELKARNVTLPKTRSWINGWEAKNPVAENVVEAVAETNTRSA